MDSVKGGCPFYPKDLMLRISLYYKHKWEVDYIVISDYSKRKDDAVYPFTVHMEFWSTLEKEPWQH